MGRGQRLHYSDYWGSGAWGDIATTKAKGMGITLRRPEMLKRHALLRLLEFPILIALILSIALHIAAWKMLPHYEPLPTGKSHGWLKIFLLNANDSPEQGSEANKIQSKSLVPATPPPETSSTPPISKQTI